MFSGFLPQSGMCVCVCEMVSILAWTQAGVLLFFTENKMLVFGGILLRNNVERLI